jgi:hypothetical protein
MVSFYIYIYIYIYMYVCVCARARILLYAFRYIFLRRGSMALEILRIPILKQKHTSSFRRNALTSFGNDARGRTERWKAMWSWCQSSAVCSSDVGRTALTLRHRACGTASQCGCGCLRLVMRCVCRRTSPLPSFLLSGD